MDDYKFSHEIIRAFEADLDTVAQELDYIELQVLAITWAKAEKKSVREKIDSLRERIRTLQIEIFKTKGET